MATNYKQILADTPSKPERIKLLMLNKGVLFSAVQSVDQDFFDAYKDEISEIIHTIGYQKAEVDEDLVLPTTDTCCDLRDIFSQFIFCNTPQEGSKNGHDEVSRKDKRTLLRCAIDFEDLGVLNSVLGCWGKCIMNHKPKYMNFFHPSFFLLKNDLIVLSGRFPLQFRDFISNLDLVDVHPSCVIHNRNKDYAQTPIVSAALQVSEDCMKLVCFNDK